MYGLFNDDGQLFRVCGSDEEAINAALDAGGIVEIERYITTDQAEAYANARVREALEQAYHELVDLHQSLLGDSVPASIHPAQIANIAANRISAMIPKERT